MSDSDSFGENPFRSISAKQFPDKNKSARTGQDVLAEKRSKRVSVGMRKAQHVETPDEDNELFLNAMSSVKPVSSKARSEDSGFSLEERGALEAAALGRKSKPASKPVSVTKKTPVAPSDEEKNFGSRGGSVKKGVMAFEAAVEDSPEDDASAFLTAMGAVDPLQGRGRDVAPSPEQTTPPPNGEMSLQDFMDGKLEFALTFSDEYLEGHVVGLDEMIMNKLRSGSLSPEAHLDLHGLNAMQAFEALRGFFKGSWYKGLRTVLVVPGRGRNSPDGVGILREKLQSWLTQEPFKRVVLAFCTAQPHDGGPGSVYVLLRKYRKKGRIYWERMPADSDLY